MERGGRLKDGPLSPWGRSDVAAYRVRMTR